MKNFALIFSMALAINFVSFADSNISYGESKEMKSKDSIHPSKMGLYKKIGMHGKCKMLQQKMRKLWIDHDIWTRQYIISSVANLSDSSAVADRLMKNQEEIGQLVEPYYGKEAANKLTELLKQHILIATDVVRSTIANDKVALNTANQKWHNNANQIAIFLSSANPTWEKSKIEEMLNKHLSSLTDEVTARLKKDWKREIQLFDEVLDDSIYMADALSIGIAKQFQGECKEIEQSDQKN